MDPILDDGARAGDFILREVEPTIGRRVVTVTGGFFEPGSVLSEAGGKYGPLDPASENIAVVYARIDAEDADVEAAVVITALTSLKASHLAWPEGITDANKAKAIATMNKSHLTVIGE